MSAMSHHGRQVSNNALLATRSSVGGLLLHVIDDKDRHRALLHLEFQPELLVKGVQQREGASWIRCGNGAPRWRASARIPTSAQSASLKRADRAEIDAHVPG